MDSANPRSIESAPSAFSSGGVSGRSGLAFGVRLAGTSPAFRDLPGGGNPRPPSDQQVGGAVGSSDLFPLTDLGGISGDVTGPRAPVAGTRAISHFWCSGSQGPQPATLPSRRDRQPRYERRRSARRARSIFKRKRKRGLALHRLSIIKRFNKKRTDVYNITGGTWNARKMGATAG
eukprot:3329689-Pyramimonas_sp.AAC.1